MTNQIRNTIQFAIDHFLADKSNYYSDTSRPRTVSRYSSYKAIVKDLPHLIQKSASIPTSDYFIYGSISTGNITEVPWLGIFDRDVTLNAEKGYYIVYLFKANMEGVYLSLNQGWTQYGDTYGTKQGRIKIYENSQKAKELLNGTTGFNFGAINLEANNALVRGYEGGNICSKYYSKDHLPSDEQLIDDVRNLIGVYRELKALVGIDILGIQNISTEEDFQENIQLRAKPTIPEGPLEKRGKGSPVVVSKWIRDINMAAEALRVADYLCEIDNSHITFPSRVSGRQFMEGHHLIPLEFQTNYIYSLDVPENIVSLCPNCHKAIHHASNEIKKILIENLYLKKVPGLRTRGISCQNDELMSYYSLSV